MDESNSPTISRSVDSPSDQTIDSVQLNGVKTNNLKNIDVRFPHNSITVVTGPSGCGKSSLVFDTLYAESKRQFLDSLSFQARQSLQFLPRPDIQNAAGLLPVVCINQQTSTPNSLSTVATVTGIHDFLRLLMTRIGTVKCFNCDRVINQNSTDQIEQTILGLPERTRVMIIAPVSTEKGSLNSRLAEIRKAGFVRVRLNGEIMDLDSIDVQAPGVGTDSDSSQNIEAVVDRVIVKPGIEDRVAESVAHALKFGEGTLGILQQESGSDQWKERIFSTLYTCPSCHTSYEEIETRTFSYFSPFGICLGCEGAGNLDQFSFRKVCQPNEAPISDWDIWKLLPTDVRSQRFEELNPVLKLCGLDQSSSVQSIDAATSNLLFHGNADCIGLQNTLEKIFVTATDAQLIKDLSAFRADEPCPTCHGTRLCTAANNVFVAERNIGSILEDDIVESIEFFRQLPNQLDEESQSIAQPILLEIANRLEFLQEVGVGYLTLDRRADSLSGGEFQRVRLATGLGNRLTDVCYVLDEPTAGLHPADNRRLLETIRDVRKLGNTVIIVEHDSATMKMADHLIDLGPGAGDAGGHIQAKGDFSEILSSKDSTTAKFLNGEFRITKHDKRQLPPEEKWISLEGATLNNLKGDPFRFPTERLTTVTGVSGSGKSTMVSSVLVPAIKRILSVAPMEKNRPDSEMDEELKGLCAAIDNFDLVTQVVEVDQSPIGRSPRSNAATFTGMFDHIRNVFAKTKTAKRLGLNASQFSFNNKSGACPNCNGHGVISVEMRFMPDVVTICEICHGKKFRPSILEVQFKEKKHLGGVGTIS